MPAPPPKRRRLFTNFRVRNGGSNTSFLTPGLLRTAEDAAGSSTDEEENEDLAQYYLDKMTDDTNRRVETVFGKGVDVWKSFGGTVYADLDEREKRRERERDIWGKRKRGDEKGRGIVRAEKDEGKKVGVVENQATKPNIALMLKPDFPLPPVVQYRHRREEETQFHRGSAGIDPLGNYNRPVKLLPKRARHPAAPLADTSVVGTDAAPDVPVAALGGARRIVSGSFGSFDEVPRGRFDERAYRLGPKGGRGEGRGG